MSPPMQLALPLPRSTPAQPHSVLRRPPAPVPPQRVFMVGCPRSGTTVLQAAVCASGALMTLPETHFFLNLLGGFEDWLRQDQGACQRRWQRRLGWVRPSLHQRLAQDLEGEGRPMGPQHRLPRRLTGRSYVRHFLGDLDAWAQQGGHAGWLEKSPDHLAYLDVIAEHCPQAKVIHVVRHGEDVLASAIDAEARYMAHNAFRGGVAHWVERWNRAVDTHLAHAGRPGHLVVCHEDFVADPAGTVARIHRFVGLPAVAPEPGAANAALPTVVADLHHRPWQTGALGGPIQPARRKFEDMFGPGLQGWIRQHLRDWTHFRRQLDGLQAPA
ncbi:sulfotransferase family protein [Ideonella livida]|uniref:Sulfotransferase n=1 Tax=Ideonella livida TaxID=2707176 RepID=A0A7C9TN53_9BURK|nr:sulfotransferase [Ideonella livida]NDY92226.1 sulfotransferase [Ideonella livida]